MDEQKSEAMNMMNKGCILVLTHALGRTSSQPVATHQDGLIRPQNRHYRHRRSSTRRSSPLSQLSGVV